MAQKERRVSLPKERQQTKRASDAVDSTLFSAFFPGLPVGAGWFRVFLLPGRIHTRLPDTNPNPQLMIFTHPVRIETHVPLKGWGRRVLSKAGFTQQEKLSLVIQNYYNRLIFHILNYCPLYLTLKERWECNQRTTVRIPRAITK